MRGRFVGYARKLHTGPELSEQILALGEAGCHPDNIWFDVAVEGRRLRQLEHALCDARRGDVFVVAKLKCLGGWKRLATVLDSLQAHGVEFYSIAETLDTRVPGGHLLFATMQTFAPMRGAALSKRIREGLAAARQRGRIGGRRPVLSAERRAAASQLIADGRMTMRDIARRVGVSRSSLYNGGLGAQKSEAAPKGAAKVVLPEAGSTMLSRERVR
jgi:DNA invertase Pin-like site-specific DNA recombinase